MATTVLIRCRNEQEWIGHAIQSVIDFCANPEIIVLDDYSNDDSIEIVRMFEHHVNIKTVPIIKYSPGAALNQGFSLAKTDAVLVLSAHCVLSTYNEKTVGDLLGTYAAVFGRQTPVYRGRKISKRYIWENFGHKAQVNPFSESENRHFLHNAFCAYNRKAVMDNPFDVQLFGKEDRYWAKTVIPKGYKILYSPEMHCFHHWTSNGATWKGIG